MSSSDPLNIITNPPQTIVKVHGTSREEVNGQLGIAVQYNTERGRYTVHMVQSQTTMALKTENLVKASQFETYKAQFTQLTKDPRVRQQVMGYYNQAQRMLGGVKPEYAAGGMLLGLVLVMYFVGFTKTLMAISMILMIGVIIGPDLITSGTNWKVIAFNFPRRCRETIETSAPFLRGKRFWTNQVATGIVVAMLLLSGKALITSSSTPKPRSSNNEFVDNYSASARTTTATQASIEDAYKLGFEDATKGVDFGTSMPTKERSSSVNDFEGDDIPMDYTSIPPAPKSSPFGFSQAMSIFFLYRTATQLGGNPFGGTFSMQQFLVNLQAMPVWQMGLLGFSLFNLVRGFINL